LAETPAEKLGRSAAMRHVQQEARDEGMPTDLNGVKWLMTESEVKALRPASIEGADDQLVEKTKFLGREALIHYIFKNGNLTMFLITYPGNSPVEKYDQTRIKLIEKYGALSEPSKDKHFEKVASLVKGRFRIDHTWMKQLGIGIEQVLIYRTPGK
jgi:hypothetical protein